jgi:hypothetical protein
MALSSLPQLFDPAHDLMTGRDGLALRRQFSSGDVQVGAADAAGLHFQQGFARTWIGNGHVFQNEWPVRDGSGMEQDSGAHDSLD